MSTTSPLLELILTGTWSSLTCWMRGNRRERASLALIVTCRTLLSFWYENVVLDRYLFLVPPCGWIAGSSTSGAGLAHGPGGLPCRHQNRIPYRREGRCVREVQGGHVFDGHPVP